MFPEYLVLLSIWERMPGWRGINKANDLFELCVSSKNWEEKEKQVKKKKNPIFIFQNEAQSHRGGEISLPVQSDLGCPLK